MQSQVLSVHGYLKNEYFIFLVLEKQNKKKVHKLKKGFVSSLKHIRALCLQMSRSWKKNKKSLSGTDQRLLINDQCQDLKLTISIQKHTKKD